MRIVIDMQGAQTESRYRGIGRYSLSHAQAIVRNRGEHEVVLVLNGQFVDTIEPIRAAFHNLLPQENIRVWYAPGPVRGCDPTNAVQRDAAELIREAFLASLQPDLIHLTSLFEGYGDDAVVSIGMFDQNTPVSVSLYDLIPLMNAEHYLRPNPLYEEFYFRKLESLKRASLLLAISESSRKEGVDHLGVSEDQVINVSTAAESCFESVEISCGEVLALRDKFHLLRPFVLYTGGADERKNLPRLLGAYASLPPDVREAHQLVFAGRMPQGAVDHLRSEAQRVGLGTDELVFTGYVSDDELLKLYNLCKVFAFPSWHEGFGLPALEAMACGAAVIAADTSSLPEVVGCSDGLFDPFDSQALCGKLTRVLVDEDFRASLKSHGLVQASKFTWDRSARETIAAFEHFLHKNGKSAAHPDFHARQSDLVDRIAEFCDGGIRQPELVEFSKAISRISMGDEKRQLFVDISELAQRDARTGIQRVTRSILKELLDNPPHGFSVQAVYATVDGQGYRYARAFCNRFRNDAQTCEGDDPIDYQAGDIFLGLDLQHHVVCAQQTFLDAIRRDGVQVVFVVYDLLPILMPHVFPPGADSGHKAWLGVLAGFDGALCISRAVAMELDVWLRENGPHRMRPFEIGWFHLGADVESSIPTLGLPDDAPRILAELSARPTFLTVGTVEPRKGQSQALAAFDLLWAEGIDANFVIVGKQGWMVERLIERIRVHPELGKRLYWLEGISDEYLERIYQSSTCLIAASEGEGYGLPLIEAAQHKRPIIVRDIPVFREVAGTHAYYFNGSTAEDLAAAVREWLRLYHAGRHPVSNNMLRLTWKESAEQLKRALLSLRLGAEPVVQGVARV
ncbi:glycosyltransferase family 1 protein [Aromatoleum evansii]|uniref:Glycosyltransferase family 1 protein n=1 Tax=Aromatoleum evansii TaxID=59406 RepID=A0ABZ1ALA9_AROEV|nr:glycosyltransferase family 1 protein [Aromatoleum evansii]